MMSNIKAVAYRNAAVAAGASADVSRYVDGAYSRSIVHASQAQK